MQSINRNFNFKKIIILLVSLFVILKLFEISLNRQNSEFNTDKNDMPRMIQGSMLKSQLCTQDQFFTDVYNRWCREMDEIPRYHRKQWEFVYIVQALFERDMLKEGRRGIGFGVGREPLPSVFAKYGVEVMATDLNKDEAIKKGWSGGNFPQHLDSTDSLYYEKIIDRNKFEKLIKTAYVDMNNINEEFRDYDFTWSSCSMEHLGSIEKGLAYVENTLKTLKPGGIAIHTTEFNLSSDSKTLDNQDTVLFRKKDMIKLIKRLRAQGHEIDVNFNDGDGLYDKHVDVPPYQPNHHLKLLIDRFKSTSFGLIIRKKI